MPAREQQVRDTTRYPGRPFRHRVCLLSSPFRYADRGGHFGRARLYGDRIELAAWHLYGRRTRVLPLDRVVELDYHPLREGSNVTVQLDDGETLPLRLDRAHVWREQFEHWLRYDVLPSAKLLQDPEEALTLAG